MKKDRFTAFLAAAVLAGASWACGKMGGGPSTPAEGPAAAPATTAAPALTPVEVSLTWDGPKDMDLEIWDESGKHFKARSFHLMGEDITTGGAAERFQFKMYETDKFPAAYEGEKPHDFSSGKFVVSVYFHEQSRSHEPAIVVLNIKRSNGEVEERRRKIEYESGKDQWHAFRIDAVTGEIQDIDEFYTPPGNAE